MRKINSVGNVDDLRRERDARMNPPEYEAGQGDDGDWDFFSDDGGGMDESAFNGSINSMGSSSFGSFGGDASSFGGTTQGGFSNPQQNLKNMTSTEDKVIEVMVEGGKICGKGAKELFNGIYEGLKDNDAFYWTVYGKKVLYTGVWITILGGILSVLGWFTILKNGFWVAIGGLLTVAIGVVIFTLNCEKAKEIGESRKLNEEVEDVNSVDEVNNDFYDDDDNGWGGFSDDYEEQEEIVDEEYDPWDSIGDSYESSTLTETVVVEEVDIDSAIGSIREIPPHTQTRQYLFEEFSRILPLVNPDFATLKPISEHSDDFIIFDKVLRDAAIQVGTSEEKIPVLLELKENQFIIQIKATRPIGLKEEEIANEISNIYSRDENGGILHEGVYATTSSVGSNYIINIFKGENSLVTLADTYREVKDYILDTSVKKPIVMGVNEFGKVWKFDAENIFSYIVSGKPRTGKSWSVVALVVQLSMYSSPKEVNFEAFDVKGTSSDFYSMQELPHFKNFESNPTRILSRLRYLTTVEAERRKKILQKYDVINIADLKEKGVDAELPYLYIIVDEIMGLKGSLSKEEDSEFKSLINTFVTQMPNLGYRVILVPHRVTNEVISKTTYTLVGCVACVKSDFKEISTTLEITKKDFPYSLPNKGDMALKTSELNKGVPVFCHGVALTKTNEGNKDMYKFIGSLWGMLEPDTSKEIEEGNTTTEVQNYNGHKLIGVESIEEDDSDEDFWNEYL